MLSVIFISLDNKLLLLLTIKTEILTIRNRGQHFLGLITRHCPNSHRIRISFNSFSVWFGHTNLTHPLYTIIMRKTLCAFVKLLKEQFSQLNPLFVYYLQVSLLRSHAGEHLLLSLARRSLPYRDILLLGNDTILPRHVTDPAVSRIVGRILDEVITPLREVNADDTEIACLKSIVFFDPGVCLCDCIFEGVSSHYIIASSLSQCPSGSILFDVWRRAFGQWAIDDEITIGWNWTLAPETM